MTQESTNIPIRVPLSTISDFIKSLELGTKIGDDIVHISIDLKDITLELRTRTSDGSLLVHGDEIVTTLVSIPIQ